MTNNHLIERLNQNQKAAYKKVFGSLIVMAPAGTGKTDVIALRAFNAYLQGVKPENMLLLTFTNRAAKSMKKRITEVMKDDAAKIKISTFHGLCGYILRQEASNVSINTDFIIIDQDDARQILKDIVVKKGFKSQLYYNEEQFLTDFIRLAREFPYTHGKRLEARSLFLSMARERNAQSSIFSLAESASSILNSYLMTLRQYNLMDFTSLVVGVLGAFKNPSVKKRWQEMYSWIELDEVQDTNKIEYDIIKILFEKHSNIGLFGDIHQTIYEWRGSVPNEIIRDFKINHPSYTEIRFEENYRSAKNLLFAANSFLTEGSKKEQPEDEIDYPDDSQSKIKIRGFGDINDESIYIANKIKKLAASGASYSSIAVLTRTNKDAKNIGEFLQKQSVPTFVIDKARFFSRNEIKNALAYIKLMINPRDILSFNRINEELSEEFSSLKESCYLEISDFLKLSSYKDKDPYSQLTDAFEKDDVVVFDVETTGLDVKNDKIIQIAALRGGRSGIVSRFERFIKIDRSVGASFDIHKISDETLFVHGISDKQAIDEFMEFLSQSVVIGHNVNYDISILKENMKAVGIGEDVLSNPVFDTLSLSRRLFEGLNSYRLESLQRELSLSHIPTHNAMDDVICTLQLLEKITEKLESSSKCRKEIFRSYEDRFYPVARNISELKELCKTKRPQDVLHDALIKSRLLQKYEQSPEEMEKLRELYRIFREYDNDSVSCHESLVLLLEIASLGNDTDRFLNLKDQVPVITVHQAKGLEFDCVFIYNAIDDNFPSSKNKDEKKLKEEKRLFYVAITRPKKKLYITYSVGTDQAKGLKKPSRFIHQIHRRYIDFR